MVEVQQQSIIPVIRR